MEVKFNTDDLFGGAAQAIDSAVNNISQAGPGSGLANIEDQTTNIIQAFQDNIAPHIDGPSPAPDQPAPALNRQTQVQGWSSQLNNWFHQPSVKAKMPYILGAGSVSILMTAALAKGLKWVGIGMGVLALYLYIQSQPHASPANKTA